ncbi:MAG: DUF192 domain-containing protein [Gammaproteobacteria bacterium]|nr:DUF192 domain-containing protein [Gammaproteobacteria bacterium]
MTNKPIRHFAVAVAAISLLVMLTETSLSAEPKERLTGFQKTTAIIETSTQRCLALDIFLADNLQQQMQGLMFIEMLGEYEGMLFRYRTLETRKMWMKNTLIPLDMLFILPDGRITNIAENTTPLSAKVISSSEPVMFVLELNGGFSERHALRPDNRLLSIF